MSENGRIFPEMTPKAAAAFDRYISMGPKRSIRGLAAQMVRQDLYKNSASAERVLNTWSSDYQWQSRIASSVTALADARLEQAAELDAASFLKTSERIAERLDWTMPENIDTVLKMRESVRKPSAKQAAVSVNLTVIVDDLARKYGLTDDEREALFEDMQADMKARAKAGAS